MTRSSFYATTPCACDIIRFADRGTFMGTGDHLPTTRLHSPWMSALMRMTSARGTSTRSGTDEREGIARESSRTGAWQHLWVAAL